MTTATPISFVQRQAACLVLPLLACLPHANAADLAADLADATFEELVYLQSTSGDQRLTILAGASKLLAESVAGSVNPAPGGLLSGGVTTTAGLRPSFQISASSNGIGGYSSATAHIRYIVRLDGPTGGSAPMAVPASGWASASSAATDVTGGYGRLTISSPSGYATPAIKITRQAEVYSPNRLLADAFDDVIMLTMVVGVPYTVDMFGTAQSNVGTTTVYLDPLFQFAAGFDSTGFQLRHSPGLVAAVPEPGNAALLLPGLAAMAGLAAWRRRGGRHPSASGLPPGRAAGCARPCT